MKIIKVVKHLSMYYVREMVFISPFKKTIRKLTIYFGFFMSALVICSVTNFLISKSYFNLIHPHVSRFKTDLKYILIWNPKKTGVGFDIKEKQRALLGQKVFIKQKCKYFNCFISYDENLLKDDRRNFDAVIFKGRNVVKYVEAEVNMTRSPDQLYIFNSLDSSELYPVCNKIFEDFFNWTWTYKLNSDVVHPFFNIYNVDNNVIGPKIGVNWTRKMDHTDKYKAKMRHKNKAVAWIVNKCRLKAKHDQFIKDLRIELTAYNYTLDIFGPCGDKKCPKGNKKGCYDLIEKHYFFQMVMEETFAEDFVTEKMVKAMNHIAIPIVMGGSDFNRFLPPGSYINAQSFDLKKLGAIIDYLIKKRTTYEYFFDWKNHYYYMARQRSNMCELCKRLNENNIGSRKTYSKFRTWWNPNYKEHCRRLHYFNQYS